MNPHPSRRRRAIASVCLAATLLVGAACSGVDAADPGSSRDGNAAADSSAAPAVSGTLFDPSVVHDLSLTLDEADLDEMIAAYEETGEKSWIEVTATVDGTTYERAGLRLKGNSSLRGASGAAAEDLPWLVRLDKFVDGQTHEGYEDIVVRSNSSTTALNESVALALLDEAGLASQASSPARFSVNGSDAVLRLIVEHPDDDAWHEASFDGDGALYKAESTGDWSYRGDDEASYEDVFDREAGSDVTDLTPLIDLLRFLDGSDDATFADELPRRLDVDAFATYLAMMDLVGNFDDIDGPGNNSYLWWDASTEQFTVVPWDLNLAFGASPGGGGFGGGGGAPGGGAAPGGGFRGEAPGAPPQGVAPGAPAAGQQRPGGRGSFGRTNPLVERFRANEEFEALYQQKLTELQERLFDSGRAQELLDERAQVLVDHASDLVDEQTVRSDADRIAAVLS